MEYVLVGIAVIFVVFVLWALIKGNDFKSKEKEKKETPPPPKNEDFVLVTEEKPKKVKIKKKEEKVKGEAVIVPVFAKQEQKTEGQSTSEIDEKEELYKKYIEKENNKEEKQETERKDFDSPLPITDRDIQKRIEEIRKNNFEATSKPEPTSTNEEPAYYGYGVGAGGHSHRSLRDPNFDPWPDENKPKTRTNYSHSFEDNSLLDDDDDFIDMEAIDRIMAGSSFPRRSSKLGSGSVKSNLGTKKKISGEDIVVGQTIGTRKGIVNPFDDN